MTKKIIYTLISMLVLSSCKKDFLEVPDKTVILRQAYVKDLKSMGDFLNGVYVNLQTTFLDDNSMNYVEVIADNVKPTAASVLKLQYNWSQQANERSSVSQSVGSDNANGLWIAGYRIIRDCNFIIEEVDKYTSENNTLASDIKGQAYGIRALVHFTLVNAFAQPYGFSSNGSHKAVPYVLTTDLKETVSRGTVAGFYTKLIGDLSQAVNLLPVSANVLAMNKNAAMALLSKVYLFKEDYQQAKNWARSVIQIKPLMTDAADYPSKLFTPLEKEALFQLKPSDPGSTEGAGKYYTSFMGTFYALPYKDYVASNDIASLLKEDMGDIRNNWVTQNGADWDITKYPKGLLPGFGFPSAAYYQTIFRSSDMYLVAAESYVHLNLTDSARFFVDAIRQRANPNIAASSQTGSDLLELIYKERRKEFCFEGYRMFDLLHQKKGVVRSDGPPNAQNLPYPSNKAIAPIPVMDVNLSGLAQNEDY